MLPLLLVPLYVCYPGAPVPRSEPLVTGPGGSGGNGVRGVDRVGVRGGGQGVPQRGRTGIARRAGLSTNGLTPRRAYCKARTRGSNHVPIKRRKRKAVCPEAP